MGLITAAASLAQAFAEAMMRRAFSRLVKAGGPFDHRGWADAEQLRDRSPALTRLDARDGAFA